MPTSTHPLTSTCCCSHFLDWKKEEGGGQKCGREEGGSLEYCYSLQNPPCLWKFRYCLIAGHIRLCLPKTLPLSSMRSFPYRHSFCLLQSRGSWAWLSILCDSSQYLFLFFRMKFPRPSWTHFLLLLLVMIYSSSREFHRSVTCEYICCSTFISFYIIIH